MESEQISTIYYHFIFNMFYGMNLHYDWKTRFLTVIQLLPIIASLHAAFEKCVEEL